MKPANPSDTDNQTLSALELAQRASATMHASDRAAHHNGIEILEVSPGQACLQMRIQDYMVNGLDVCHGGYIFLLGDTAMAHASNSHNQVALAASAAIDWLQPGQLGDYLTATASQQTLSGRTGIYYVEIRNQADQLIALLRGKTQQIRQQVVVDARHQP